jgi:hypothetical protein
MSHAWCCVMQATYVQRQHTLNPMQQLVNYLYFENRFKWCVPTSEANLEYLAEMHQLIANWEAEHVVSGT